MPRFIPALLASTTFLAGALFAAPQADTLQYVVIMSRHGNRSPLWTDAQQNAYSAQPWPKWDVPIGYLTAHGRIGMEWMGEYYRQYYTKAGLLATSGCATTDKFYFWSDTDERDIETGRAIASRLFRDCPVIIHRTPAGKTDPLFSPIKAQAFPVDVKAAAAALSERMRGSPDDFAARYRAQFEEMQKVLLGCEPEKTCDPARIAGKKLLLQQASGIKPDPTLVADFTGPLKAAATVADMLLLEYAEGMKPENVGWGRVNKTNLRDFLQLQQAYVDLVLRSPYEARANGSNLLSHILKSLEQAANGSPTTGSLGRPSDKGLVFLGHDSNESYLEALLGTSWKIEGYPDNSRPPGSALIFELWKNAATARYTVRTWFVTQTLDQMRNNIPLSLSRPPLRVALNIPGCGGFSCDWDKFRQVVTANIDPAFVSNAPLPEANTQAAR